MNPTDTRDWANEVIAATERAWHAERGSYEFSDSGFAVFFSPVRAKPKLLVVGFNPGASAHDFSLERARQVPAEHDYFAFDYPMARRMRALFSRIGLEETLRESVKTNIVFFRSKDKAQWSSMPARARARIEQFCLTEVAGMVTQLQPEAVLCEGMDTFDRLAGAIAPDAEREQFTAGGARRAYCRIRLKPGVRLIGMLHPTGSRPSAAELDVIAQLLAEDLAGHAPRSLPNGSERVATLHRSPTRTPKRERQQADLGFGCGCGLLLLSLFSAVAGFVLMIGPDLAGFIAGLALLSTGAVGFWLYFRLRPGFGPST